MSPASKRRRLAGEEVEVARYELNPQYCGTLLYFMQYAEQQLRTHRASDLEHARVRMVDPLQQPTAGALSADDLILNPWGYNALPIHLRLEEGCT